LLALGIVCGLILAGVNSITAPVIAENERQAKLLILGEFYNVDDYAIEIVTMSGAIDSVFFLKNKTNNNLEKAVYSVRAYGYQSDIVMLIAVNNDLTIDQYKVVSQGETAGIGDVIVGYDFGMAGENVANLDAFAGPTASISSGAVRTCFTLVAAQAAIDFAGLIVPVDLQIVSIVYNLDETTFVAKPFIATINYGEADIETQVYLARNFSYVEMVDGADAVPDQTFLTELQLKAQQVATVSNRTYFNEFNAATNTIIIASRGYGDNPILLTVLFNASLDTVVSITITSGESYDGSHDYDGSYGNPPGVENHLVTRFESNQSLDAVAGATITSNAMIRALQLLEAFVESNQAGGGGQ
jgi:Na+-translocating ferredoxin:NAD+ oxidoreductase RnfG subunit